MQCTKLAERSNAVRLGIDDVVQAAVREGTDLGLRAKPLVAAGDPLPSGILVPMVIERLSQPDCVKRGYLLHGFPRTRDQALALQMAGSRPCVMVVDLSDFYE